MHSAFSLNLSQIKEVQSDNYTSGEFTVIRDYCDNVSKHTYDDDGESIRYIWHFVNTESVISHSNPTRDFIEKLPAEVDYYLVFMSDEKQPRLIYCCEQYEYTDYI